ncbi:MAG: hypothetical protein K0Q47_84 [Sedimentibacter sp.]|jgi:hypothetical protein|nr:hypothetical protein [Sedimentibacter sp.]
MANTKATNKSNKAKANTNQKKQESKEVIKPADQSLESKEVVEEVTKEVTEVKEEIVEEKKDTETKTDNKKLTEEEKEKVKKEAEAAQKLYDAILLEIEKIIPKDKFKSKTNNSGVTFFGTEGTRAFKVVKAKKGVKLELNVPVSKVENLTILTEKEASEKHMGTCRWIYIGDDIKTIKNLIKEAVEKYEPKKRSDSKEEKDKREAKEKETKESKE